jgi:hypothetical protein
LRTYPPPLPEIIKALDEQFSTLAEFLLKMMSGVDSIGVTECLYRFVGADTGHNRWVISVIPEVRKGP